MMQDITYVYDPVGNIVKITDSSHEKVYSTTGPVEPKQEYTYDSLYRLVAAGGRTHNALGKNAHHTQKDFKSGAHLNDITQMSAYNRSYSYDEVGNMHTMQQTGTNPFTRYIKIAEESNKAILNTVETSTDIVATAAEISDYFDENGNQKKLDHLNAVTWNYRDNIASATIIARTDDPDDVEYYIYDASGQRTRKVKETWGSGVVTIEEKIYLGTVEIKRKRQQGQPNTLERWSLHMIDDKQRIGLIHHWTVDTNNAEGDGSHIGTNKLRYQYSNHLGSASLEIDGAGQVISYEEYFPYGGTSFMYGANAVDVKLKEYRYTGKERDDSTGLYYYGARYYAPWLGRWLSADPAGPVDGLNLYQYVSGNPVRLNDPSGTEGVCGGIDDDCDASADEPYEEEPEPEPADTIGGDVDEDPGLTATGKGASTKSNDIELIQNVTYSKTEDEEGNVAEELEISWQIKDASGTYDIVGVEETEDTISFEVAGHPDVHGFAFTKPGRGEILANLPGGGVYQGKEEHYEAALSRAAISQQLQFLSQLQSDPLSAGAYGIALTMTGSPEKAENAMLFAAMIGMVIGARRGKGRGKGKGKSIVIGEGMKDIRLAARQLRKGGVNAKWYQAWTKNYEKGNFNLKANLQRNKRWIRSKKREGYDIYDIGIDPARTRRSPFYSLEKTELGNYPTIPIPRP
ncbi:MAG: RHS repeat-associated core domain-containing protein [Proteobacteria bacterium]|nr:RHS repeat-associated core domain-containing protein [Pseudomonadota bacterium]